MNSAIPASTSATEADFQLVSGRARELMLRGALPKIEDVQKDINSLDGDGRWTDINYEDATPAGWDTSSHLRRVRRLARAWVDPQSPLYNDPRTGASVEQALDNWIAHRYKNPNWWHNDIGVPQIMGDIVVLLGDRLNGARREGALAVWHQYGKARPGDGANTMWMAELALMYGVVTHNGTLVADNATLISNEIHVSKGEGIQSDNSYHQHGARLQQFHYGSSFINNAARLGWQLHGTPWAIPSIKLQIIANCVLEGSEWMVRGTSTIPGTLDRSVSRVGALEGGDLRCAAHFLRDALPASAPALDALIARQDGTGEPLGGFRAFPRSDFAAFQRPVFAFFLKTVSDRTALSESINGENLKGHLLNCGDHYFVRDGGEYARMPPVWDWDALPGVTYAAGAGEVVRQPFVGSVSDGTSGFCVMDARFASKEGATLSARKLWAAHGDVVVCLIADVTARGVTSPVHTALDQCELRGPVTVADANGNIETLQNGVRSAQHVRWIHHCGFVYIPLGDAPVALKMGPVTGSWSRINKSGSKSPVTVPVFLPTLEHGVGPQEAQSGFVVAPAATPQDAARVFDHPSWKVVGNDATWQSVVFDDGTRMMAFYSPTNFEVDAGRRASVVSPCLFLRSHVGSFICDPTQKGGTLTRALEGQLTLTAPRAGNLSSSNHRGGDKAGRATAGSRLGDSSGADPGQLVRCAICR